MTRSDITRTSQGAEASAIVPSRRLKWIGRASRIVIAGVVAGLLLVVAGNAIGPEHFWLSALAEYAPYPAFLLPSLVAVGLSTLLEWRWRAAALLGLLLVTTTVMGLEFNRGEPGTGRVRIMTYNIKDYITLRRPDGLADIAAEIARHDPDIIVVQDARSLIRVRGKAPAAAGFLFGDRQTYAAGQYIVASRFPLLDCSENEFPIRASPRTFVSCVVVAGTATFDLLTAHLVTPRLGFRSTMANPTQGIQEWRDNVEDRMAQAEGLAKHLAPRTRPAIVAGDFNAPVTSLVVRTLLETGFNDAFSAAGVGYGHTWGHSLWFQQSFLRIDHILVGPEFGVANCFVGGSDSAHRPVIADLYLKRNTG